MVFNVILDFQYKLPVVKLLNYFTAADFNFTGLSPVGLLFIYVVNVCGSSPNVVCVCSCVCL